MITRGGKKVKSTISQGSPRRFAKPRAAHGEADRNHFAERARGRIENERVAERALARNP